MALYHLAGVLNGVPTALGLELKQLIRNLYGVDFPAWRFTGVPSSNTDLPDSLADIDIYIDDEFLDPREPIPAWMLEGIEGVFGQLDEAPDNYAKYWDEFPPGSINFYPDGTTDRIPSSWDSLEELSPEGQQAFEEWLTEWIEDQNGYSMPSSN